MTPGILDVSKPKTCDSSLIVGDRLCNRLAQTSFTLYAFSVAHLIIYHHANLRKIRIKYYIMIIISCK